MRALWVTRWSYSRPEDIERLFVRATRAGFNTVFFQVRGRADAFYASRLEPWAAELTGELGKDPGFDPLATALRAGQALGLQVHAWVNLMPAWSGRQPPRRTSPEHIVRRHPEWLMADARGRRMRLGDPGYLCVSPGIPAVQDHLVAVMADLLERYPVDGLHLDYVRYCGPEFSHDPVSRARYAEARRAQPELTWVVWQQRQVTQLVRRIHTVTRRHPGVALTAAVWHNYDLPVPGSRGLRDYYQDPRAWLQQGLVDAVLPMTYLRLDSTPSFGQLVDDHLTAMDPAQVVVGVHAYGRELQSEQDRTGAALLDALAYARDRGAAGVAVFASTLLDEAWLWEALGSGPFLTPVPAPRFVQKPRAAPTPRGSEAP